MHFTSEPLRFLFAAALAQAIECAGADRHPQKAVPTIPFYLRRKGSRRRLAESLEKCGNFAGKSLPEGDLKDGRFRQEVL